MVKEKKSEKEKKQEERVAEEPIEEAKEAENAGKELEKEEEEKPEEVEIEEKKEKEPKFTKAELRRREREKNEEEIRKEGLASWVPRTETGKLVKQGKIKNIDEILDKKIKIFEPETVDKLISLKSDLLNIGQSKGKFGGGKRRAWRQTQRKSMEGNIPTFACMAVIGDGNGHVGIGLGKAKETLPAREKALREAKLNVIKVKRGCGSFNCSCKEKHSIPFKVEGKTGSVRIVLIPAPQGTGLVIGDECKKILRLAGVKDIYSKTFGQVRTTINVAKACIKALEKTNMEEK